MFLGAILEGVTQTISVTNEQQRVLFYKLERYVIAAIHSFFKLLLQWYINVRLNTRYTLLQWQKHGYTDLKGSIYSQ